MILARYGLARDEDTIVALAEMQVRETLPHLDFDANQVRFTYQNYLHRANPTIFVAEVDREVVGYLVALTHDYAFTSGQFVNQEVLYVRPDKRGTRAAARLLNIFNEWADQVGAKEVFTGIANGFQPERTKRFLEHFGFTVVGFHLRRIRS